MCVWPQAGWLGSYVHVELEDQVCILVSCLSGAADDDLASRLSSILWQVACHNADAQQVRHCYLAILPPVGLSMHLMQIWSVLGCRVGNAIAAVCCCCACCRCCLQLNDWLADTLPEGSRVGFDPFCHTVESVNKLKEKLEVRCSKVAACNAWQMVPLCFISYRGQLGECGSD